MLIRLKSFFNFLIFLVVITFAVGVSSSFVTRPEISNWYATLVKPSFNPPNSIFGPVWTVLYVMMAWAAWLVWQQQHAKRGVALGFYFVQLLLNGLWSWLFFKFHLVGWAVVEILLLWLLIGITTRYFWRVKNIAGLLMIPYWLWVSFAAVLNGSLWWLNR